MPVILSQTLNLSTDVVPIEDFVKLDIVRSGDIKIMSLSDGVIVCKAEDPIYYYYLGLEMAAYYTHKKINNKILNGSN